ncbi:MAG: HAD-IA family hydrolase [Candidatus Heimdallarchaeota archaeon]|nr:MAG: HAD-IA family hydrolase [Candidatus Heimdallarchaeota archaeon]
MKLQCLVFDVDGTLVDNTITIIRLFQDIVKKYLEKEMSDQDVLSLWGPPGDEIFKSVFPSDVIDPAWEEFLQSYREVHTTTGFFTKDQLSDIKNNIPYLTIFTGKSRNTMAITLEKLGIIDIFDLILTGNDVTRSKPYPDALYQIISTLHLNKSETLFIGDSHLDIIAGKAAGIKTAAALWGAVETQKLIESKPDYTFDTPQEFIDFVLSPKRSA